MRPSPFAHHPSSLLLAPLPRGHGIPHLYSQLVIITLLRAAENLYDVMD